MATESRGWDILVRGRWARRVALAGVVALSPGTAAAQQPPAPKTAAPSDYEKRVVAFLNGGASVSRAELGEFLIARGGMDKVELLVNKKIIETEAARRGVSVTTVEVSAALTDDLRGLGVKLDEFEQHVLPRYGKTLYEWTEDVIRPRLFLTKMCRENVTVTDADLQKAFETKYGEKREAQIIKWPKQDPNHRALTDDVKATAAAKPEEFEKLAAAQPDDLKKSRGRITPIGRHIDGENPAVEAALFSMKVGEIRWVESPTTSTCIRCLAVIPPDPAITPAKVRTELEGLVREKKFSAELRRFFEEMKKAAMPTLTEHVPVPKDLPPDVPKPVRVPSPDPKLLAVVYGNVPVTREDLGEFLIARGGYEKLDLLVNKKIIEMAAARTNLTVTPQEVETAFAEDVKALGISKDDFIKVMLPKYKMTLTEWTDDALRPRLMLAKMVRGSVTVTADDLSRAFENKYGEKRRAKVIMWGKGELRQSQRDWEVARKGDADFDRMARGQSNTSLAARAGETTPVGRHVDAESDMLERVLFSLQVGEVSHLFETPAGIMCVKCVEVLPPTAGVKLEQVKDALEREVFAKKLDKAIPAHFGELKKAASPNLLLKGPPTPRENRDGVDHIIRQAGGTIPPMK